MTHPCFADKGNDQLSPFTWGGAPDLPAPFDVTPEMMRAGWDTYENLEATYPPSSLVVEIYKAMAWERHLQDLRAKGETHSPEHSHSAD